MRKKIQQELPPLCVAVKRVREAYGDSQERFAHRIGVALMSVSRFETGRAEPRDPRVLLNLAKVAYEKSLKDEGLFRDAYQDYERIKSTDRRIGELESFAQPTFRSLREWRLSCAARLAVLYYPEQVAAMEKAAAAALAIIDDVLSGADENQINYASFEREAFALAERQMLKDLQKRKEQGQ
jgi:transcriptional regulator with XRE-family HTH domain